jgi:hypothetical protein
MRCSIAILFTCLLLFSCPIGKGGCTCETWNGGTNSKILGGPRQTRMIHVEESWREAQSDPRRRPWRTYREVLQEDSRSSMYRIYDDVTYAKTKRECVTFIISAHAWFNTHDCSLSASDIVLIGCLFFRRLIINHDSHKFILEFGTVVNKIKQEYGKWQL